MSKGHSFEAARSFIIGPSLVYSAVNGAAHKLQAAHITPGSTKFVTLFLTNFDHPLPLFNFVTHLGTMHTYRGLGGVVVIDAAIGAHGKSRPRFKPGTLLHRCSDLGQVVNLSLSVA